MPNTVNITACNGTICFTFNGSCGTDNTWNWTLTSGGTSYGSGTVADGQEFCAGPGLPDLTYTLSLTSANNSCYGSSSNFSVTLNSGNGHCSVQTYGTDWGSPCCCCGCASDAKPINIPPLTFTSAILGTTTLTKFGGEDCQFSGTLTYDYPGCPVGGCAAVASVPVTITVAFNSPGTGFNVTYTTPANAFNVCPLASGTGHVESIAGFQAGGLGLTACMLGFPSTLMMTGTGTFTGTGSSGNELILCGASDTCTVSS
jgi:hypothetical protein